MNIFIGADHAGFILKQKIKAFLEQSGHTVSDMGAHELNNADDYTDFIVPVAKAVSEGKADFGIVLGGSGQGEAMAANRFSGVRASVYYGGDEKTVVLSREHNNANILSLGARFVSPEVALRAVEVFLNTPFSEEERHSRRNKKIDSVSGA